MADVAKYKVVRDPEWEETSYDGMPFFYNKKTNESRWAPKYIKVLVQEDPEPHHRAHSSGNSNRRLLPSKPRPKGAKTEGSSSPDLFEREEGSEGWEKEPQKWSVKIHIDSGQPFFRNAATKVDVWSNPWSLGQDDFGAEKLASTIEEMERAAAGGNGNGGGGGAAGAAAAAEEALLDGAAAAPVDLAAALAAPGGEAARALARLDAWARRRGLRVTGGAAAVGLRWPEYLDFSFLRGEAGGGGGVFAGDFLEVEVYFLGGGGGGGGGGGDPRRHRGRRAFRLRGDRLADVLAWARPLCGVAPADDAPCLLKVCGRREYLRRARLPLAGFAACRAAARRAPRRLRAQLIQLDEVACLELGPSLDQAPQELADQEAAGARGLGPEDRHDPPELEEEEEEEYDEGEQGGGGWAGEGAGEGGGAAAPLPLEEVAWPFQVRVRGCAGLPLGLLGRFARYAVEVNLYHAGRPLLRTLSARGGRPRLDVTAAVRSPAPAGGHGGGGGGEGEGEGEGGGEEDPEEGGGAWGEGAFSSSPLPAPAPLGAEAQGEEGGYDSGAPASSLGATLAPAAAAAAAAAAGGGGANAGAQELRFPGEVMPRLHNLPLNTLPPTTRVGFMVVGYDGEGRAQDLAGAALPLCDCRGRLMQGARALRLWPARALAALRDPPAARLLPALDLATCVIGENPEGGPFSEGAERAIVLHVVFDSFLRPVVAKRTTLADVERGLAPPPPRTHLSAKDRQWAEWADAIAALDPLQRLPEEDLQRLRERAPALCRECPRLLPRYLQAADWSSPERAREAREYLLRWASPSDDDKEGDRDAAPLHGEAPDWDSSRGVGGGEDEKVEGAYKGSKDAAAGGTMEGSRRRRRRRLAALDCLELLGPSYTDPVVREFAVARLGEVPDPDLDRVMLQLVQALKYEPYVDSPLARFLLRRALRRPALLGHRLYWLLAAEMHAPEVCVRFGVLLRTYLAHCGPHRRELRAQAAVNAALREVAEAAQKAPKAQRTAVARRMLRDLCNGGGGSAGGAWGGGAAAAADGGWGGGPGFGYGRRRGLPARFTLCVDARVECVGLRPEECRVMASKKAPLWAAFEPADPCARGPYVAIFKAGDDLRQDMITLQMLQLMDEIWLEESGADLAPTPYGCVATGKDLGMIEVVPSSRTISEIQQKYGGRIVGAFRSEPINLFLRESCHSHTSKGQTQRSLNVALSDTKDNFIRSCAGYCVATYMLGIGDRHSDNIMVSTSGHLFHIDFGHFLGNFKSKFGIRRERAPFVFTPEMKNVIENGDDERDNGDSYGKFKRLCCEAYNDIRRSANLFITLFQLMIPAQVPELLSSRDVHYLQGQMRLRADPEQASQHFEAEIRASLNSVSRRVDNFIHNLKVQH